VASWPTIFTSPEGWHYMTPEQRLDRAERILLATIKAGRRAHSDWQYKINSLINAQIRHEEQSRIKAAEVDEQLKEVAAAQARLSESHELTEKALRDFIERTQRKNDKS
jgi:hypothetical protein